MKSIIEYGQAVGAMALSKNWADLIGKPGHGGSDHVGSYAGVSTKITIHWQPVPGAKNYHDCPETLCRYINSVVLSRMPEIVAEALALQQTDLRNLAKAAVEDCQKIISEAEAA